VRSRAGSERAQRLLSRRSLWRAAQLDGTPAVFLASCLPRARDAREHPERPARITAIESSLAERGWLGYEVRQAPPASREMLVAVHSAEYVDAVPSISESGGGAFDQENMVSGESYRAAAHESGAACAMVEALLAGAARVAFCAIRPPGHHARADTTSGFCLFNHVAVASRHALDSLGARRVCIFDWDVHHGDGTNDIFRATDSVLFASIHQSRIFPGTGPLADAGAHAGEGYSINLPVEKGSHEDAWFSLLEYIVIPPLRSSSRTSC
jgi:acetoin utilization deacetylase AcuC-like enzyme